MAALLAVAKSWRGYGGPGLQAETGAPGYPVQSARHFIAPRARPTGPGPARAEPASGTLGRRAGRAWAAVLGRKGSLGAGVGTPDVEEGGPEDAGGVGWEGAGKESGCRWEVCPSGLCPETTWGHQDASAWWSAGAPLCLSQPRESASARNGADREEGVQGCGP